MLLRLAVKSGIPFEVLHNHTTADAPETVFHIRDTFRRLEEKGIRCDVDKHIHPDGTRTTMWNLIPRKLFPPTRLVRYCCAELKEGGGKGRFIATGVRWAESAARKNPHESAIRLRLETRWLHRLPNGRETPLRRICEISQVSAVLHSGFRPNACRAAAQRQGRRGYAMGENRRRCVPLVDGGRRIAGTNNNGRYGGTVNELG